MGRGQSQDRYTRFKRVENTKKGAVRTGVAGRDTKNCKHLQEMAVFRGGDFRVKRLFVAKKRQIEARRSRINKIEGAEFKNEGRR